MTEAFAYDEVRYPSHVYPQLHPSRLAAIARLHAVAAASPKSCRLLEVGCGDGMQLLTLAMTYPDSQFIGVDLSAAAIARGEAMRVKLGLANLSLVAADLLTWDPGELPYDYIVAHGFYSWVPDQVRTRLLELCGQVLMPSGVACVSYNTLPGCHLRRMLWEILQFHSADIEEPAARIAKAQECLELLKLGMPEMNRYATVMTGEINELMDRLEPNVLFHDDLAAINEPFTLDQFICNAGNHGLTFLAEASYHEMSLRTANENVRPLLAEIAQNDIVTKEQYLDFFTGRRFRQTILCRRSANPGPHADPAAIHGLELVADLKPDDREPDAQGRMRFSRPSSGGLVTDNSVLQTMLMLSNQRYPHAQPVQSLLDESRIAAASGNSREQDLDTTGIFLRSAFEVGIVELHCDAPRFADQVCLKPCASPLARAQAEAGEPKVVSLRPSMVSLDDPYTRCLLEALDGSRDRAGILAFMAARMEPMQQPSEDGTLSSPQGNGFAEQLEVTLQNMTRLALLSGNPA